jgi:hypothetical protein
LLTTYAEKFASSKGLEERIPFLGVSFEGFYLDPNTGNGLGSMGRCSPSQVFYPQPRKEIKIGLNQLYLLNKFGLERYLVNPVEGEFAYLDISFSKMMETCCHELAHYIQMLKWGKSSCESDLVLGRGNYDGELAKEHKEFSEEIRGMIGGEHSPDTFNKGLEFAEWERRWREIF